MAGVQGTLIFNDVEFPNGYVAISRCHYAHDTKLWVLELSWWMTKALHDAHGDPLVSGAFPKVGPFPDTQNANPIDTALVEIKSWFEDGEIDR